MARTPCQKLFYTNHGEREHEKVRENKRRSREKKRHLKKLLKMKEVCFFIFTDGYALCVICGLPEQ